MVYIKGPSGKKRKRVQEPESVATETTSGISLNYIHIAYLLRFSILYTRSGIPKKGVTVSLSNSSFSSGEYYCQIYGQILHVNNYIHKRLFILEHINPHLCIPDCSTGSEDSTDPSSMGLDNGAGNKTNFFLNHYLLFLINSYTIKILMASLNQA